VWSEIVILNKIFICFLVNHCNHPLLFMFIFVGLLYFVWLFSVFVVRTPRNFYVHSGFALFGFLACVGRDSGTSVSRMAGCTHFNSLAPCGARFMSTPILYTKSQFQFTHSCGARR
jgi:hypothetical protein